MDAKKQDRFMKDLILRESKEAITELRDIINDKNYKSDHESENIRPLITLCIQESENVEDSCKNTLNNNFMNGYDIINIITHILKHRLDFSNRLDGTRNIVEQWQKTRAFKNEEFSIKIRESGNDYLRIGQINKALFLYNEALLYGIFAFIQMTI